MSELLSLKDLEKKAWKATFQDGLLEICIGLVMFAGALSTILTGSGVPNQLRICIYVPLMFMGPIIYILCKKYVTIPRIGVVKFGPKRIERRRKALIVTLAAVGVTWLFLIIYRMKWLPTGLEGWLGKYLTSMLITAGLVLFFCVLAYLFDQPRLYLIAFLFGLGEPLTLFFSERLGEVSVGLISFGIPAIIVLSMGFVLLVRFVKDHPIPSKGGYNASL